MAIDRKEVVRVALKDQFEVATRVVPPGFAGYDGTIKPVEFNPEKAKQLLAQAGYPDGKGFPELPITFRQDIPYVGEAAQVVARQLQDNLHIKIQIRPMEWAQFLTDRTNKTMPLSHLRWGADYLDPQNYLSLLLHTSKKVNGVEDHPENGIGYSNTEFDSLCDQADTEKDSKKRMELYLKAEQIAVDDAAWVPMYFQKDLELVNPKVKGIRESLLGHLPHLTTTVK